MQAGFTKTQQLQNFKLALPLTDETSQESPNRPTQLTNANLLANLDASLHQIAQEAERANSTSALNNFNKRHVTRKLRITLNRELQSPSLAVSTVVEHVTSHEIPALPENDELTKIQNKYFANGYLPQGQPLWTQIQE